LASWSPNFQNGHALAAPIDFHLHIGKLGFGGQDLKLARSARNTGHLDFVLQNVFPNYQVQGK
jgi:hypothetical protein